MAERYAAQRSTKNTHRRALPRLSDTESVATLEPDTAEAEQLDTSNLYDVHEIHTTRPSALAVDGVGAAGTATAARPRAAIPRRSGAAGNRAERMAASIPHVSYAYVVRDLRRIAITAVAMFVLLIVLNVVLQSVI